MSSEPGRPFSESFDPGPSYTLAWRGVKLNPIPMFLGGLMMQCTSGGGGGTGNIGRLFNLAGSGGGGSDNSSGGDFQWEERLGALGGGVLDALGRVQGGLWRIQEGLPPEVQDLLDGLGGGASAGMLVAVVLGALCCGLVVGLTVLAINTWLTLGWLAVHREVLEKGTADVGRLFSGGEQFLPLLLWRLLNAAIVLGVMLVAGAPGGVVLGVGAAQGSPILVGLGAVLAGLLVLPTAIWVGLGLMFGQHAVVFEGLQPLDALERSWSVASGNRVITFIFLLVGGVVALVSALLGLCMLCVGLFITLPLARAVNDLAFTRAWLLHTRPTEESDAWRLPELA